MNQSGNMSDYRRTCDSFHINVPEYYNFGFDTVDRWAAQSPDKRAMVWVNQQGEDRTLSFGDISRASNRMANLLTSAGVKPFDRILLLLPRIPEWWIATVAIIKTAAIHCPAPVMLTEYDLRGRIHAGEFAGVITDQENAGKIDDIIADCPSLKYRFIVDGERSGWIDCRTELARQGETFTPTYRTRSSDPLVIYFTSGTNNVDPKMVQHNHALPLGHEVTARFWHDLTADDLHFSVSDTGWAKCAWGKLFGQWLLGAAVFVYDIRGKFHASELL
ncbi:MAG: AMP-binding protein, partial [Victivallales bacterium]|nr:AMP-binding protein [Victivallales bacterium]